MAFQQNYKPYGLILDQSYAYITPFPVGFAEYFCTHPLLLNSFRWRAWWHGFWSWRLDLKSSALWLACVLELYSLSVCCLLLFCNIFGIVKTLCHVIYRRLGCDINLEDVRIDYWSRDRYGNTLRFFLKGKAWQSGIRARSDCRMTLGWPKPFLPLSKSDLQKFYSSLLLLSMSACQMWWYFKS